MLVLPRARLASHHDTPLKETPNPMADNWKRNVTLFLASQAVSLFGSLLVQYAITWHITLRTQSGAMMTLSVLTGFLPMLILAPFAGVWADRYDRKLLIAAADAVIAAVTLLLAALFYVGYDALWLLLAASAVRSLGSAVQQPAVGAFLPQITPGDQLTRVNATNTTIQSVVGLVSPLLSGVLLTAAPIEAVFLVDVTTAALAIAILIGAVKVPVQPRNGAQASTRYLADLREGFAYIRSHDFLRPFFLFNAVFFILAAPGAFLTPLQVARTFGGEVWRLTAIEIAFSVGMMLGGLLMAAWEGFANRVHSMAFANLLIGMFTVLLGVTPDFWLYLVEMAAIGISLPIFNTPATVLLQQRVEGAFLGRVFSISSMLANTIMPLAMLVYGPVADRIPIEWLLVGTGLLVMGMSVLMLANRALVRAGLPVESPEGHKGDTGPVLQEGRT